ncbi:Possible conserved membrane protein [Mycobacterium tuberculosis]|uniref:Possible conserved membrane protein n=1 Tax=Mycobacterium tuberculosis TaxID=1773 RepID=A0A654U742_MYCTX|nr:Possible conserved membrane protein [Mycobacterium tuberculosis]CFS09138.1 Possible conserved membrane protein [Mycobacterium tuberculosis]CKS85707.1 Possible conserved membrane protein [Mycobacterium tuberculosis]CNV57466.1 Possible conserved membrane protein [Mycobacterium tuberculosis]CNV97597.1 Possible conserved membrane protein [Mycobacterium tuberculosis]
MVALALVSAMTAAIIYGVRTNGANTAGTFSEGPAKTAIQGYLNALENRDVDTIVRNALCGIHDGVRDKRSDQALAKLSSDAFRKQFSQVEVTSIDKIVYWSQYQAQVLFTMQVTPAAGGPPRGQVQGIAQLLFQRGQVLVCSYVLRTAGSY